MIKGGATMLHATIVRSSRPHAYLRAVDVSAARAVPGVRAVLVGADLVRSGGLAPRQGVVLGDEPLLATGTVRYVGEPIAAIAADDPDAARAAARLIAVDYEDIPAVVGAVAARAASPLHPVPIERAEPLGELGLDAGEGPNACCRLALREGDPDGALARAARTFEDVFSVRRSARADVDPGACEVSWDPSGRALVRCATSAPHRLARRLARVLSIPASHVRVQATGPGPSDGEGRREALALALALETRRPVRLDGDEGPPPAGDYVGELRLTTAVDGDGRIVARRVRGLIDAGAYAGGLPRLLADVGRAAAGPYPVADVDVELVAVYTNAPPASAHGADLWLDLTWAHERQMDLIADRLGADALELRLAQLDDGAPLRECARAIGWGEPVTAADDGRVRARGIACGPAAGQAAVASTATARVNDDGSVNVLAGVVDGGDGGLRARLAERAIARLGVAPEQVHVAGVDTAIAPGDDAAGEPDGPQRALIALDRALDAVCAEAVGIAARLLNRPAEELSVSGGGVVAADGERLLGLSELVRRSASGNLIGHGRLRTAAGRDRDSGAPWASPWRQSAAAVEVALDPRTGAFELTRWNASGAAAEPGAAPASAADALAGKLPPAVAAALGNALARASGAGVLDLPPTASALLAGGANLAATAPEAR